mmetsp:Transcript_31917/g.43587  ORF Transcript_31917/g.43587 Transcript_31917/m.43587 type:complete len:121 (-) Transcript_31917:341-703(-)
MNFVASGVFDESPKYFTCSSTQFLLWSMDNHTTNSCFDQYSTDSGYDYMEYIQVSCLPTYYNTFLHHMFYILVLFDYTHNLAQMMAATMENSPLDFWLVAWWVVLKVLMMVQMVFWWAVK